MGFYQYAPTNQRVAAVTKFNPRSIHTATISFCPHTECYVVFKYTHTTPAKGNPKSGSKLVGNDYLSPLDATCAAIQSMPPGSELGFEEIAS